MLEVKYNEKTSTETNIDVSIGDITPEDYDDEGIIDFIESRVFVVGRKELFGDLRALTLSVATATVSLCEKMLAQYK